MSVWVWALEKELLRSLENRTEERSFFSSKRETPPGCAWSHPKCKNPSSKNTDTTTARSGISIAQSNTINNEQYKTPLCRRSAKTLRSKGQADRSLSGDTWRLRIWPLMKVGWLSQIWLVRSSVRLAYIVNRAYFTSGEMPLIFIWADWLQIFQQKSHSYT